MERPFNRSWECAPCIITVRNGARTNAGVSCKKNERAQTERQKGMSDEEMARAGEGKDTAYEYLCRLEEAKQ